MPELGFIYGLCEPSTGELRYVGKTKNAPEKRLRQHVRKASTEHSYKARWLLSVDCAPKLAVLERVSLEKLDDRERDWIAFFNGAGARLTNLTAGGDGFSGDGARAAGRLGGLALAGTPKTAAHREAIRIGRAQQVISHSPETRVRMSVAAKKRGGNHKHGCACGFCTGRAGTEARWGSRQS